MKKILTIIIVVAFAVNSAGQGYALRPMAAAISKVNGKASSAGITDLRRDKGESQTQIKLGKLERAQKVMETYANWRFRDYENNSWYHVNVLKEGTGQRLLERIKEKHSILMARGSDSVSMSTVNRLVREVPSIENPHTELFVDILPGMSLETKNELFAKQITIEDWFGSAFLIQISRGCYNQCTFCQFETKPHMCYMPFPIFIKILDECGDLMLENGSQLLLHRDDDSFQYKDSAIGANFADVYEALMQRGFEYGLLTAGWSENDRIAQAAAERLAMGTEKCDISFNLYRKDLVNAVMERSDAVKRKDKTAAVAAQRKIDKAYKRIKERYRNVLATLKPILNTIDLERISKTKYRLINNLTWRMYEELKEELGLEDIHQGMYRMGELPENQQDKRDYDFLEGEKAKGYFIFRPYGNRVEVGYTGNSLVSLKRLAESGILHKEDLSFLLNMVILLRKKHTRNVEIDFLSLPRSMRTYLQAKGVKKRYLRLLDFDIEARRFLKEVYVLYYPQFLSYLKEKQEILPEEIDGVIDQFGDIPVMNGIKLGRKPLIDKLWLRNHNQEFRSELVLFEAPEPIEPVLLDATKTSSAGNMQQILDNIFPVSEVEEMAFSVNKKTYAYRATAHYIRVGDFYFIPPNVWYQYYNELLPYKNSLIVTALALLNKGDTILQFPHTPYSTMSVITLQAYGDLIKDQVVFDAGCGFGLLSAVASRLGAKKVIAIDIDSKYIEEARTSLDINGITNVEVYQADILGLKPHASLDNIDIVIAELAGDGLRKTADGRYYNLHGTIANAIPSAKHYFALGLMVAPDKTDYISISIGQMVEDEWQLTHYGILTEVNDPLPASAVLKRRAAATSLPIPSSSISKSIAAAA